MAPSERKCPAALILLFCLAVQVHCNVDRYSLQVVERGTLVSEEVEIDLENRTEIIRVPQHNDVDAVQLFNDFNSGLSAHRVPSAKDCYVFKLDPSFPSPRKMKLDMEQASKQRIPNKVTTKKVVTRVLGLSNRLTLPRGIVDFCGTFPIYTAEEVSLDSMNATFHKIQGHGRMKRNHVQVDLHHCSRAAGLEMQRCYELMGFTYEQKCEYKTAHCYYIVRCRHNSNRKDRKYTCEELVHRVNYTSLCCEAIC